MRLFISQPMKDKTNEEIQTERNWIIAKMQHIYGNDIDVIDSFFKDAPHDAKPLWFLARTQPSRHRTNPRKYVI